MEDAQRMERLVTRLLELARHENAAAAPASLLDSRAHAATLLRRYGERVRFRVEGEPSPIALAPEELDAVLTNLVENALRQGAPVQISMCTEHGKLRIAVRDHGPGVSEGE